MTESWRCHVHDDAGFTLRHPAHWQAHEDALGSSLLLVEPADEAADPLTAPYPTNVAVSVLDLARVDVALDDYVAAQLAAARRVLTDLRVIEARAAELAGAAAQRVLATYRVGLFELTSETWLAVLTGGRAVSVHATAETQHHGQLVDTFEAVAASLTLDDTTAADEPPKEGTDEPQEEA